MKESLLLLQLDIASGVGPTAETEGPTHALYELRVRTGALDGAFSLEGGCVGILMVVLLRGLGRAVGTVGVLGEIVGSGAWLLKVEPVLPVTVGMRPPFLMTEVALTPGSVVVFSFPLGSRCSEATWSFGLVALLIVKPAGGELFSADA